MEISFCDRCNSSIPEPDLERGVARRVDGAMLCAGCLHSRSRQRTFLVALLPLALVAAAALGAGAAVLVLRPGILADRAEAASLREDLGALAGEVALLGREVDTVTEAGRTQLGLIQKVSSVGLRGATENEKAVGELAERTRLLSEELVAVKEHLRQAAAGEPGEPGGPAAPAAPAVDVDLWLSLTEDADPGVRLSALLGLEGAEDPRVADRSLELLADGDATVRAQAARMLGEMGEARAVGPLLDRLADVNIRVRSVALGALREISGRDLGFYDPTASEEERAKAVGELRELLQPGDER